MAGLYGVDTNDLVYLSARWLTANPETIGAADSNLDGRVDLADLAILSANWLRR
jgi:hypothetical protein